LHGSRAARGRACARSLAPLPQLACAGIGSASVSSSLCLALAQRQARCRVAHQNLLQPSMWLTVTAAWLRLQGQNARPRAQGADESDDGGARRLLRSHVAAAAAAAAAASGAAASAHHKQAAGQVRGFQSQAWGPCACSCSLQERREATYSAHASALGLLWASSKHITNIVGQCQSLCTVAVRTCSPAAQGGDAPLSLSVVRVRASAPVGASLPRRGGRRRPAMPSQCPPARRPRARRQPPCLSTRARGQRSREPRLGHLPWPAASGAGRAARRAATPRR